MTAATTASNLPPPAPREAAAAALGRRALSAHLSRRAKTQRIRVFDRNNRPHDIELPTTALRLLEDILNQLAEGHAVKVLPIEAELTSQQAADLLGMSRPHLVKLLDAGALPHRKAGKHRRVRLADVVSFKAERDRASEKAMRELARQAQELRLGYE